MALKEIDLRIPELETEYLDHFIDSKSDKGMKCESLAIRISNQLATIICQNEKGNSNQPIITMIKDK